jgi:dienelactone hydrolase
MRATPSSSSPGSAHRRRWRHTILLAGVVLFAAFALSPPGRAYNGALLLVADIATDGGSPLRWGGDLPSGEAVTIAWEQGDFNADLYRPPAGGRTGGLILVAGYPANIDDPQLVKLAQATARLGITTLIPRLPGLSVGHLTPTDADVIVAAFEWLQARPEVAHDHIGIGGFCIGSSLALLAAANPRIRADVALVNVFGGYYDLRSYLRAIATETDGAPKVRASWHPADAAVRLFTQNIVGMIADPTDRQALINHVTSKPDPHASLSDLSALARAAHTLLTSTDPDQIDNALQALALPQQAAINRLSPSEVVDQIQAHIFVMHDRDDPYVPAREAALLRAALQPEQSTYTEFTFFAHVRPDRSLQGAPLIWEYGRLMMYLAPMLRMLTPT